MTDFQQGDELAAMGDQAALEYGWWANEWLKSEAKESQADISSRAAFTYALTVLENRHGRFLSRSQITDRIRIGKAFPHQDFEDLVEEMKYNFTFSQLRAAYVKDDHDATMALLLWAAEVDASPVDINAKKTGEDPKSNSEKAWDHVVEWCRKFRDRCEDPSPDKMKLVKAIIEYEETKWLRNTAQM
jgi:hypothetical protein